MNIGSNLLRMTRKWQTPFFKPEDFTEEYPFVKEILKQGIDIMQNFKQSL